MMYQYPYGNAQQLNLDWILGKIKELESGSGGGGGAADLEEIANALISASYAAQNYSRSDIVFYDGKLYRANQNITAEAWNPAHWDEILIGDTVANLVRYVGSLDNSQVVNSSNVAGTHTSDALNNLEIEIASKAGGTADSTSVINIDTERRFFIYYNTSTSTGTLPPFPVSGNAYLLTFVRDTTQTNTQFSWQHGQRNAIYMRKMINGNWLSWRIVGNKGINKGTKALLIGDSYNYGTGGVGGKGWGYYLQQLSQCDATIIHQNGGGFAAAGNSNADYPNHTYAQLVSSINVRDFDLVVVQAGWNDASTSRNPTGKTAVVSGVNDFVSAAKTRFPDAEIVIIPTYSATAITLHAEECLNAIAQTAIENGVKTTKCSKFWMQPDPSLTNADTIHLIDAGYQLLAKFMWAFINGWDGKQSGLITPQVSDLEPTGITTSSIEHYKYDNIAVIKCDVTLTATVDDWSDVLSGLAPATSNFIDTMTNWSSTFKRNIRVQASTGGQLRIRYGEAGSYRICLWYPIPAEW